jgi:hypothetical protein
MDAAVLESDDENDNDDEEDEVGDGYGSASHQPPPSLYRLPTGAAALGALGGMPLPFGRPMTIPEAGLGLETDTEGSLSTYGDEPSLSRAAAPGELTTLPSPTGAAHSADGTFAHTGTDRRGGRRVSMVTPDVSRPESPMDSAGAGTAGAGSSGAGLSVDRFKRDFTDAMQLVRRADTAARDVTVSADGIKIKTIALLLPKLQVGIPEGFVATFNHGTRLYLAGRWRAARRILRDRCLKMMPDDKPTRVLLDFMGQYHFKAPEDWRGVRNLTRK